MQDPDTPGSGESVREAQGRGFSRTRRAPLKSLGSRRHACDRCRRQKLKVETAHIFLRQLVNERFSFSVMSKSHALYASGLAFSVRQHQLRCGKLFIIDQHELGIVKEILIPDL